MLRLMSTDSCSSVRDAAVECVCISRLTLPAIMMRVRDVSKDVRTQARGKMMRVVAAGVGEEALNVDDDVEDSVQDTTTVSDE